MSQSLSILYIHATFGTKGRNPWINEEIATDLHAYMASIFKALDSPAVIINSMPDHIHVLFRMSKTVMIAEVIEETKKSSSKWIKKTAIRNTIILLAKRIRSIFCEWFTSGWRKRPRLCPLPWARARRSRHQVSRPQKSAMINIY